MSDFIDAANPGDDVKTAQVQCPACGTLCGRMEFSGDGAVAETPTRCICGHEFDAAAAVRFLQEERGA